MIEIKPVQASETYAVRHPVLRPGKPLETCRFDGDDDVSTVHFGLFEDGRICGVASLFKNGHAWFDDENQLQLRGMAVLERGRGKGFGDRLLRHAERYASENGVSLIWFNARIAAVPFYEKSGYQKTGEGFDIGDIGLHYVMFKTSSGFVR